MPTNITSPNTARFVVNFIDSFNISYTPSSASVTLVYPVNGVLTSSVVTLALSGGFWTGDWSSVGVDVPANVAWTVVSSCSPNPAQSGTIRIIDP